MIAINSRNLITSARVAETLRDRRNWAKALNKSISEAESILMEAGRGELRGCLREPREIEEEYYPPTIERLAAIQVGDVVWVHSPPNIRQQLLTNGCFRPEADIH